MISGNVVPDEMLAIKQCKKHRNTETLQKNFLQTVYVRPNFKIHFTAADLEGQRKSCMSAKSNLKSRLSSYTLLYIFCCISRSAPASKELPTKTVYICPKFLIFNIFKNLENVTAQALYVEK